MEIRIKYAEGVEPVMQAHDGEWYDLRAAEDVTFHEGDIGDGDVWGSTWLATKYGHIEKNTRIAQSRIQKTQPEAELITVTALMNDNRGGYGSSGAT